MNNLKNYFFTDFNAMTTPDWIGLSLTVAITLLMVALYTYVLLPKNGARLEAHKHIVLNENEVLKEDKHVG